MEEIFAVLGSNREIKFREKFSESIFLSEWLYFNMSLKVVEKLLFLAQKNFLIYCTTVKFANFSLNREIRYREYFLGTHFHLHISNFFSQVFFILDHVSVSKGRLQNLVRFTSSTDIIKFVVSDGLYLIPQIGFRIDLVYKTGIPPSRQICRKSSAEVCIFVYIALHIECRFNKNSSSVTF